MTGGQNFLSLALKRFVGGTYDDQVKSQVVRRQGDVLPALRNTASIAGNVLEDCRLASKISFDILKYDIYNRGVPKTPEAVKAVANKLVDASTETRRQFMSGVIGFANALKTDTEEQHVN